MKEKKIKTIKNKKMEKKTKLLTQKLEAFERTATHWDKGLTSEEVAVRLEQGLVNRTKKNVTKSYGRMVYDNFFTFFNVLLYLFAILVCFAGKYNQLLFLGVITANSFIGFIQDIRARKLVEKLSIVNKMQTMTVRDGKEGLVYSSELVIDDVIYLKNGDQIPTDSIILKGKCAVNEAMLTGEPDAIKKKAKDVIYAGTYVTSGNCYARVNNIGILNRANQIQAKASTFSKPRSEILKSLKFLFKLLGVLIICIALLSFGAIFYCWIVNVNPSVETLNGVFDSYITAKPSGIDTPIIDAIGNTVGTSSNIGFNPNWLKDFWNFFADPNSFKFDPPVTRFVGSMVSMIPAGMFLLTSVTLSVGVLNLARKRCLVQDLYSIEMLARVDTLWLDKTGTITDGTMAFADFIRIDKGYDLNKISPMVASILGSTKDDNFTAEALRNRFGDIVTYRAKTILPFSSETKFSAVTFDKIGTIAMGAFGFIRINNKEETEKIVNKYSAKGYRCLILCASKAKIEKEKIPTEMTCVGVLLLEDHIRDDAPQILNWFAENNVDIKVISGDDPITVSEVAKKAGIKNSNLYISLDGMSIDEVKKSATKYTIFGRVSPDQKEALVMALKEAGRCVAMTGDGVNDILALKRADCSIAMASGSDAAKNISQLVLLDSNFSVLTNVVAEGRRVINNVQRTSSLFLTKTFTSVMISIVSLLAMFITAKIELQFPLSVNNFYVWETAFIGIGGFILALEPNSKKIEGGFLSNAFKRAIPAGLCVSFIILSCYVLYIIDYFAIEQGILNPETYSVLTGKIFNLSLGKEEWLQSISQTFKSCCAIGMTIFGCVTFFRVCYPFSKYRLIVSIGITVLTVCVLIGAFCWYAPNPTLNLTTFGGSFFGFEFNWMTIMSWLWILVFVLVAAILYYVMDKVLKKSKLLKKIDKITE